MREAVLFIVAIGAFAGIVLRGGSAEEGAKDTSSTAHVSAAKAGERDKAFAAWSAGETVLPRASNGHFYAEAAVNGSSVNFLVDTGATMIALTGEDATAAGLSWSDSDIRVVAQGASGPVYGVPVRLDRVSLGAHEAENVEAAIIPDGLEVSLLGQSFLSTIEPVRIENDRMVLGG